jgi:decaprenylphospho-beta-D-ribofuranose 2-oxidase
MVVDATTLTGVVEWDAKAGRIRCLSGTSLGQILRAIVPAGWFLPVVPGTQQVTLGGAIASDIHGKNHHVDGSFGRWVERVSLVTATGERFEIGPKENVEAFAATAGGMGLTGAIVDATLRLQPIESTFVSVEGVRTRDLDETLDRLEGTAARHRYSVSWIDALASGGKRGRGWVIAGDHARASDLDAVYRDQPLEMPRSPERTVPILLPSWVLSTAICRAFNAWVYRRGIVRSPLVDLRSFFFPLDGVQHWNRVYGRRGFIQYQAVLPRESAREGLTEMLETIERSGHAAFFAGIKSSGESGPGLLSFLMPGFTLAVDIPYRPGVEALTSRLDELVIRRGGRVYLAKDSTLSAESFRAMYPQWPTFEAIRQKLDPQGRLRSDLARRLEMVS